MFDTSESVEEQPKDKHGQRKDTQAGRSLSSQSIIRIINNNVMCDFSDVEDIELQVLGTKELTSCSTPPAVEGGSSRNSELEHSVVNVGKCETNDDEAAGSVQQHSSDVKVDVHRKSSSASSDQAAMDKLARANANSSSKNQVTLHLMFYFFFFFYIFKFFFFIKFFFF